MSDDEPQNDDRDDDSPLADLLIDEKAGPANADADGEADEGHAGEIYRDDHILVKPHPAGVTVAVGRDPDSARVSHRRRRACRRA